MNGSNRPARWAGRGKQSVQAIRPPALEPRAKTLPPPDNDDPAADDATAETESAPVDGEVNATDAAKALAAQHDIDLTTVTGTGTEGRITKDDVAALVETETTA